MTYTIPVVYLEDMKKLLAKTAKKLDSIGVKHRESIGHPYSLEISVYGDPNNRQKVDVVDVEFDSNEPYKIKGFEIIAVLEHPVDKSCSGGNLVYLIGNNYVSRNDLEILQRLDCNCQHCNTKRVRKKTVILYNEEHDKLIQVGLSCLNNYLGVDISGKLDRLSDLDKFLDTEACKFDVHNCCYNYSELNRNLTAASICAVVLWVYEYKPQLNHNTRQIAYEIDKYISEFRCLKDTEKMQYLDKANKIVRALTEFDTRENTFESNVITLCKNFFIRRKNVGLAVWIPVVYDKLVNEQKRKEESDKKWDEAKRNAEYYGNVGDKIENLKVMCDKLLYTKEYQFGYDYGSASYVYRLRNGNYWFIWSTSNFMEEGKEYTINGGKIKEHSEYKGLKQTVISRCKIIDRE